MSNGGGNQVFRVTPTMTSGAGHALLLFVVKLTITCSNFMLVSKCTGADWLFSAVDTFAWAPHSDCNIHFKNSEQIMISSAINLTLKHD